LSAAGSTDPENAALSYSWDLDGDGQFDDAFVAQTNVTYGAGAHVARVRVVDNQGLSDVASALVLVNESFPTATITSPNGSLTWKVGDLITFSGTATDPEDGPLPAASLDWSVIIHHCPSTCHTHPMQSFDNVAGGSFNAPDHEYPSHLELKLTATDSAGLQDTKSVLIYPQTVPLTFASNPSGQQLVLNSTGGVTPFTRTVIIGSNNSISAPSPQGGQQFSAWSDGGAPTHNITAGAAPTTYTATFVPLPTLASLVLGFGFDEGAGTMVGDASGRGNTGTITGATWTPSGKIGQALSFDGVDDSVSVPDSTSLDLSQTGTIGAWVRLTTVNRWNAVMAKGSTGIDALYNYAIDIAADNRPNCVVGNGTSFAMVAATTVLAAQQWYHLACTWDGSQLRFYVNGILNASATQTLTPAGNAAPLFVGQYGGGADQLAGVIDEVRIYSLPLSASDIQLVMNTSLVDSTPPVRSNGQPAGTLPVGTTQTTLSLSTNENATCRYGSVAGVAYGAMPNTFTTTGGTIHSTTLTGLTNGANYTRYVRCIDNGNNANPDDFTIAFAVGSTTDTTPPLRSNGQPTGTLPVGTTQTTLSLSTNENATCRYATVAGVAYSAMPSTFTTTGGTTHSTTLTGLTNGTSYTRYVRCIDSASNANPDDFTIAFAVANTAPATLALGFGLDEGSGTSVGDASGNANTGTITGAAWTTPGKYGSALSFDGVDDVVTVADSASLDRGQTGTIGAWVKLAAVNRWNAVMAKGSTDVDAQHNYAIDIAPDNRPNCIVANGTSFNMVVATIALTAQQWYHLACTWDGSQLRFFINGNLNASAAQTVTPVGNAAPLLVGQFGNGLDPLSGVIDEVRVYSTALTGPEIVSAMNTALVGGDSTPPTRSNGQPTGTLPIGTTQTTLSLTTNEAATCRYATTAGVAYAAMTNTFATTGGASHTTSVTGLTNGTSYTYYVRCVDGASNPNTNDFPISFAVAGDTTPPTRSNGQPTGTLPIGTTQTTLSLTTNEPATCRYATTPGVSYGAMANTFATTGGTSHSTPVAGLTSGTTYNFYARCADASNNANPNDFVINFAVAATGDVTPPLRSNGQPAGTLPAGTTQTTLSLSTNENATCRYATTAGVAYSAMPNTFTTTGGTTHSTTLTGLANGTSYVRYVRCVDSATNANPDDFSISFAVASTASATLSFGLALEEGAGTVVGDASGNGNSGTVLGATWTTPGQFGGALSFDGIDDLVSVPDSASLDRGQTGTIAAWVKLTTINRWNGVLAKGSNENDAQHNYAIDIGSNNLPNCVIGNGTTFNMVVATTALTAQQWKHLACTWDGSQLRLYISGILNASVAQTITPAANTAPLSVGQFGGGVDRLAGVIDEVRVYSAALSGPDIQTAMNVALVDAGPPVRSNGQPAGALPAGTTQATLTLTTSELATCRYATTAGVSYGAMTNTFATTGGKSHSTPVTGLTNNTSYTYYVRCVDASNNINPDDFPITFSVASGSQATLRINDVSVTEANNGTKNVTFTVTLSSASSQTVTVAYATANGSALAPGDYVSKTGTLTFNPGALSATFTVATVGDKTTEGNESFVVNLSNPTNAAIADGQGSCTIIDND
jgi:hypothetical protein